MLTALRFSLASGEDDLMLFVVLVQGDAQDMGRGGEVPHILYLVSGFVTSNSFPAMSRFR